MENSNLIPRFFRQLPVFWKVAFIAVTTVLVIGVAVPKLVSAASTPAVWLGVGLLLGYVFWGIKLAVVVVDDIAEKFISEDEEGEE